MNRKRTLCASLLTVALLFSLSGCGGKENAVETETEPVVDAL